MAGVPWVCPYCKFAQVRPDEKTDDRYIPLLLQSGALADPTLRLIALVCSNPECQALTLTVSVQGSAKSAVNARYRTIVTRRLLPLSDSQPQPEYIPAALREDYAEACAIRELSPKAAATLVRRCLQGMIRDFAGITGKKTLYQEIEALRKLVDEGKAPSGITGESVEAIDQVRGIGNIGAHMEHDINLIVDVDPNEAKVLIELVEMLFAEWYVARHNRQQRLEAIKKIAEAKQEARSPTGEEGAG